MGMYTNLFLNVSLVNNLPPQVDCVINYLLDAGPEPTPKPDHPFFRTTRWPWIFVSKSFHGHPAEVTSRTDGGLRTHSDYLLVFSSFKNYDAEIEKFLDWIAPYVEVEYEGATTCLGWVQYEEWDLPRFILKNATSKFGSKRSETDGLLHKVGRQDLRGQGCV